MPEEAMMISYRASQAAFEDSKANALGKFIGNFE